MDEADLLRLCGGGGLARASLSFLGHGLRGLYTSTATRKSIVSGKGQKKRTAFVCSSGVLFFSSAPPFFSFRSMPSLIAGMHRYARGRAVQCTTKGRRGGRSCAMARVLPSEWWGCGWGERETTTSLTNGDGDGDETWGGRSWLTVCVWAEGGSVKRGERERHGRGQFSQVEAAPQAERGGRTLRDGRHTAKGRARKRARASTALAPTLSRCPLLQLIRSALINTTLLLSRLVAAS